MTGASDAANSTGVRGRGISERAWQDVVVQAARLMGFHVYHAYDSRRSEPGFPDLTMVKAGDENTRGMVVFLELK